jgi:hypothetical protein
MSDINTTIDRERPSARPIRRTQAMLALSTCAILAACGSTPPATAPASSGAAGGGTSVGGDATLQTCPKTVGTVRLQDGDAPAQTTGSTTGGSSALESLRGLLRDVDGMQQRKDSKNAGVSIDSLRLLIQQSNCLAVVERGLSEEAATDEKLRARSGSNEVRNDAQMGQGQEVAADFVLRAKVLAVNGNESSSGVSAGGFSPLRALGGLVSKKSTSSADVQLVLFDVRTKVQLAVSQGHGTGENTAMATNALGRSGGMLGSMNIGTTTNTSAATVMLQAYADAYNKLVPAIANYKMQSVDGGLGAGSTMRVQSKATGTPVAAPK